MLDLLLKLNSIISIDNASLFWFCALAGTGMFIIQFLLTLFGAEGPDSIDDGGAHIDSMNFKWLSRQAITGFFIAGLITVFITGFIFKIAKKLHSSGTVFNLEDAIGKEAIIYQEIPKNGMGKITLSLQDFTREIDAISSHQEDLPSFTSVYIIKKTDEKTVLVVPKN